MRRILNLNQPGFVLASLIGLFVVLVPAVLYGVSLFLTEDRITRFLLNLIRVSFTIGVFVFVVLLVLIILEQIQDHVIDVQYQKNRDRKLLLDDGNYECQYCGNRKVKEKDNTCGVCGRDLK